MLAGSLFPDVCVPAWLGVVCAIVAVVALGLLARSWWHWRREVRERHEERERRARGWLQLSTSDRLVLAALVLSAVGLLASAVHCSEHRPAVTISLADSSLNPAGYDNPSDEYVCLVNHEDEPVSLAGWELRAAERRIDVLPNFTLKSGAAVRVHPGEGTNSRRDLYGEKGSPQWRNDGGQISLLDSEGQEVDAVGYGERKEGDGSGECGPGAKAPQQTSQPPTGGTSTEEPPIPPCDSNYEGACLDPEAEDYDCAGGEGDGPEYVEGPIAVVGEDHFGLDSNGDGIACEP